MTATSDEKKSAGKPSAYAAAGVDIDVKMAGLRSVTRMVNATRTRDARGGLGSFGGLYVAPGRDALLVASTDGVGTKLKVAVLAGRHDTVGRDLVNHCVNDILVQGARPLFFLDYIGAAKLDGAVFRQILAGLCAACRSNGCALIGGETAEMPGLYPAAEYDLVGTIVGAVPRKDLVTGKAIREGDIIIGLPSSGLHTNGYSLARAILFDKLGLGVSDPFPGTKMTVADVLLAVHRSYLRPVTAVMNKVRVRGMAHITGGGLIDNVPRVLPHNVDAVFDRAAWKTPHLFQFLQREGGVDRDEMYRVFNMGIGYVLVVGEADAEEALAILRNARCGAKVVGYIRRGRQRSLLTG
ncbi:MAG: phosphoribosylformylglycinamidine cyclo-ligase [Lentisphaerae bacterium]|nr:phosphoribosylformylglycinamidine cyclo-ligase [Lentisphaerota bacterium]